MALEPYYELVAVVVLWELAVLMMSDLQRDGEYMRPPLSIGNYLTRRWVA